MKDMECAAVRDVLPDAATGALLPQEAAAVSAHVAACVDCATEAGLVGLLRAMVGPPAPAGLEHRIRLASRRIPRRWLPRWGVAAVAAALAGALLGGRAVIERLDRRDGGHEAGAVTVTAAGASWAVALDPLLRDDAALELSVEELELVLAELKP